MALLTQLMWEDLAMGTEVHFSTWFESLILQGLEKRDEYGNLYLLWQPMQRHQQLLELKHMCTALGASTWPCAGPHRQGARITCHVGWQT